MKRALLLVLLVGVGRGEGYETPAYKRLKRVAAVMAEVGMAVDMAKLSIEVRQPAPGSAGVESPIGRQRRERGPASEFLEESWGTGGVGRGINAWAYYDQSERRIIFHATGAGALIAGDAVAAHELVHAWQHQRDGRVFRVPGVTSERANILQFLQEGEAELGSLLYQLHRQGKTIADVRADATDATVRAGLIGPGAKLPYRSGFRFAVEQTRRYGVKRMAEWAKKAPTSSEQILHPEKTGRDLPTPIEAPELPDLYVLRMDILGEVEIYRILAATSGLKNAARVAIGWDGDQLRVYLTKTRKKLSVWISAWDRELDAEQAKTTLSASWPGLTWREGRVVYWVHSEDRAARDAAEAFCRAHRLKAPADAEAAKSTERAEKEWLHSFDVARTKKDKRWHLGTVPVSILVPRHWQIIEWSGVRLVSRKIAKRYLNIHVETWPLAGFGDIDKVATHFQRERHALYWMKVKEFKRISPSAFAMKRIRMWGKRNLPGAIYECFVETRGTLIHYVVEVPAGTPNNLRRDAWFALRSVQIG